MATQIKVWQIVDGKLELIETSLTAIYGKIQIIRTIYGAVIPEISPNFLKSIFIPTIPEREKIVMNIKQYFYLHQLSKQLHAQAV